MEYMAKELDSYGMPGSKFRTCQNGWVTSEIYRIIFKLFFWSM